eukprot:COSAG04_NODE_833_length_10004_cov_6.351035_1_plen_68_part_00
MGFYLNQDLDPGYHSCKSEGSIPGAAANTGNPHYRQDAEDTAKLGPQVDAAVAGFSGTLNRGWRELA